MVSMSQFFSRAAGTFSITAATGILAPGAGTAVATSALATTALLEATGCRTQGGVKCPKDQDSVYCKQELMDKQIACRKDIVVGFCFKFPPEFRFDRENQYLRDHI